jgi:hypothetical protein
MTEMFTAITEVSSFLLVSVVVIFVAGSLIGMFQ